MTRNISKIIQNTVNFGFKLVYKTGFYFGLILLCDYIYWPLFHHWDIFAIMFAKYSLDCRFIIYLLYIYYIYILYIHYMFAIFI